MRGGATRALADQPLPLLGHFPDRAILPAAIDPRGLGLAPGGTLKITARVTDNSPERQIGRSRAVAIAIPTRAELRTVEQDRAGAIAAYRHYLALRSNPEPALRPAVQAVRAELAKLAENP